MIEYTTDMSKLYDGKEALKQRVMARLKHRTTDIPYYDRALDISEFTYGNKAMAIRQALRDFSPNVTIDSANSRIQVYDVTINIDDILNED